MDTTFTSCAYCWKHEDSWEKLLSFKCNGCNKRVHAACIKSCDPSPLLDDVFYEFTCKACGTDGKEDFSRGNISWHNVVRLALYNLQKTGQGKCGYFHWKQHICAFIDTNWVVLFGHHRKKTNLWMGTIAGTLSSGCPHSFISGTTVGEQGYWRLANLEPPLPGDENSNVRRKKRTPSLPVDLSPQERRRRTGENSLTAAIDLKEKRSAMVDLKSKKRKLTGSNAVKLSNDEILQLKSDSDQSAKKVKNQDTSKLLDESTASLSLPKVSKKADACASSQLSQSLPDSCETSSEYHSASVASYSQKYAPKEAMAGEKESVEKTLSNILADSDDSDIDISSIEIDSQDLPDIRASSPDFTAVLKFEIENLGYMDPVSGRSPVGGKSPVKAREDPPSDVESEGPSERELKDLSEDSSTEDDEDEEDVSDDDDDEVGSTLQAQSEEDSSRSSFPNIKKERLDEESSQSTKDSFKKGRTKKKRHRHKKRVPNENDVPDPPTRLKRVSLYEEIQLLQKLNELAEKTTLAPDLVRLRRKLICNQTNREFGLPVFDLDKEMVRLAWLDSPAQVQNTMSDISYFRKLPKTAVSTRETRDLDRFMMNKGDKQAQCRRYTTFQQRLVGIADHEMKPVISPYTTRVLLPFIWRNYNPSRKPIKLKLLEEIRAYPHRQDETWVQPPSSPIDYCYVRPEHIRSVNALCREFFWPGIDMSECLQYPDFSCVVLYKKVVIGFAFMVPDRGYNEAYISFIFTHPEWRGCGIATFMLYHLIQTCMGKDVLLHVSASNSAMLLYQRFGFKAQEFILNFYDKYFPIDCRDSTSAVLMRLSR